MKLTTMKRNILIVSVILVLLISVASFYVIFPNQKITKGYVSDQTTETGLSYDYYIPSSYKTYRKHALLVVLHGGHQNAEDIALSTKMNTLAETNDFIVLYPEQSIENNPAMYWNWFLAENQMRDGSEVSAIAESVQLMLNQFNIASQKVFIAGLSAGAAMALNMAILYPELFHGVALAAGVGYAIADNAFEAYSVMGGTLPDPEEYGLLAYQRMLEHDRHLLQVIVFQGDADERVDPSNALFIVQQITILNDYLDDGIRNDSFTQTPTDSSDLVTTGGMEYTLQTYQYDDSVFLSYYFVHGMGHVWPGGDEEGTYTNHLAPDMSQIIIDRFLN
jgi:poly(hydroxyalkanoate) depolymerase family esterase